MNLQIQSSIFFSIVFWNTLFSFYLVVFIVIYISTCFSFNLIKWFHHISSMRHYFVPCRHTTFNLSSWINQNWDYRKPLCIKSTRGMGYVVYTFSKGLGEIPMGHHKSCCICFCVVQMGIGFRFPRLQVPFWVFLENL